MKKYYFLLLLLYDTPSSIQNIGMSENDILKKNSSVQKQTAKTPDKKTKEFFNNFLISTLTTKLIGSP